VKILWNKTIIKNEHFVEAIIFKKHSDEDKMITVRTLLKIDDEPEFVMILNDFLK
jgi:hypothetical protein